MKDYHKLVLRIELMILNHALVDIEHFNEVKHYKFMNADLKSLFIYVADEYANGRELIAEGLWDKCPIVYGSLSSAKHSNLTKLFYEAKRAKARIYVFNTLTGHLGGIAMYTKPLEVTVDKIIADMKTVKEVLNA